MEGVPCVKLLGTKKSLTSHFAMFAVLMFVISFLVSCGKTESPKTEQKSFASSTDAGAAFLEAAKAGNQIALLTVFVPDAKGVLFSGDAEEDKGALQDFVAAYNQMHRGCEIKVGGQTLYIGPDNFTFPIPLGKNPSG